MAKTQKITSALYPLLNHYSHLDLKLKVLLYKAAIRPIATYAAPIWFDASPTLHGSSVVRYQRQVRRRSPGPTTSRVPRWARS